MCVSVCVLFVRAAVRQQLIIPSTAAAAADALNNVWLHVRQEKKKIKLFNAEK